MAPVTEDIRPRGRTIVAYTAGVLSVLLLLAGGIGLEQLRSQLVRVPKLLPEALSFVWLGILDAALLMVASGGSLVYLSTTWRWMWITTFILWLLSIGTNCLLSLMYWITEFVQRSPQRNDFSGIAAAASFVVGVFIPGVVALITLFALLCLIYLRPRRESPVGTVPVRP